MEFATISSRNDLETALAQATKDEASANETLEIAASFGDPAQVGEAYNEVERLRLLRMLFEEALGEVEAQALGDEVQEQHRGREQEGQRGQELERVSTAEFEAEIARAIEASTQDPAAMGVSSNEGAARRPPCHFFGRREGCRNGDACLFAHVERSTSDKTPLPPAAPTSAAAAASGVGGLLERVASAQLVRRAQAAGGAEGGGGNASFDSSVDANCCICLSSPKSTLLLPCKHLCVCDADACHASLASCPICRSRVESKIVGVFR